MHQHLFRAAVLILIFSGLSCDRKAVPIITINQGCSANADCAAQPGMICDLLVVPPGGKPGTCKESCDPRSPKCSSGVCNPISGACEQNCTIASEPAQFCQGNLPSGSGATAICVTNGSSGYCALSTSSTCPNNLAPAGGFCKIACLLDSGSGCPVSTQTCDEITNTCEVGCAQKKSDCGNLQYTPPATATVATPLPIAFSCSPITSTCVPQCSTAAGALSCPGSNRKSCYIPGSPINTATLGTCEAGCNQTGACSSFAGFNCADGVCQQSCTGLKSNECDKVTGRKTCDVISGVCRTGCKSGTCATGFACSPITSTCVQECSLPASSGSPCLKTDIRSVCYVEGNLSSGGGSGSCEQDPEACPSTTFTDFPKGFKSEDGICQQKCNALAECSNNTKSGRTTCDLISSVCRVGCNPAHSGADCTVSGTSCSPFTATCVDTCIGSSATVSSCPPNSNRSSCPIFAGGTCEELCPTNTCKDAELICSNVNNILGCHLSDTNGCPNFLTRSGRYCAYIAP